jgi:hypothetical protein
LDCGGVFALLPLLVIARETIESGGNAKTPPQSKNSVVRHRVVGLHLQISTQDRTPSPFQSLTSSKLFAIQQ